MADEPPDSKSPASRRIPDGVMRQVRQECFFGCVICGMPLFEYDHIQQFADVGKHEPSNLALLCPNHHGDKTAGRLSAERVREARGSPFNANREETSLYGLEVSDPLDVWFGSNQSTAAAIQAGADYDVLWVNGKSLFTLHSEGSTYTYSASVTDELGHVLLRIDRGNLSVATGVWDYKYEGTTTSIRSGPGEILFEAEISDKVFSLRRGALVDEYETGIVIKPDGDAVFTCSGLEVGRFRGLLARGYGAGTIAVARRSCFDGEVPRGFAFVRQWAPEYESRADQLRKDMEDGKPSPFPNGYPPGLSRFTPYPRSSLPHF